MKLFKGSTRLFDKAETELSTSTPTIRKAKILGLQDVNQLVDVDLKIKAATTGNSGSAKIELYKSDDTLLGSYDIITKSSEGVVSTTLPSGWTSIDNIYTLRFNGEKFILVTGTSSGNNTLYLPMTVMDLDSLSSEADVLVAFGGIDNIKAFRKAVEDGHTSIIFYKKSEGTDFDYIETAYVVSSAYQKISATSSAIISSYIEEFKQIGTTYAYNELYQIKIQTIHTGGTYADHGLYKDIVTNMCFTQSAVDRPKTEYAFSKVAINTVEYDASLKDKVYDLVVNNLVTVDSTKALSATQGKNLKDMLDRYFGYNDDDPKGYEYYPNHFRKIWEIPTVTADVQESFRLANLNLIRGDVITKLEGYYDFGYNGKLSMNFTNPTVKDGSNYLYVSAGPNPIITYRAHFAGTNLRIIMEWERKGGTN